MIISRLSLLAIAAIALISTINASVLPRAQGDESCRHLITLTFNHGCDAKKYIAEFDGYKSVNSIYNPFMNPDQEARICISDDVVEGSFGAALGKYEQKPMEQKVLYINFNKENSAFTFIKVHINGEVLPHSPSNVTRAHWQDRTGTTLSDYLQYDSAIDGLPVDSSLLRDGQLIDLNVEFC